MQAETQLQLVQPDRFKRVYCPLIQYTPVYLVRDFKLVKKMFL